MNPYIYEKAGLNIRDINNLETIKEVRTPLLFVTSCKDHLVPTEDV